LVCVVPSDVPGGSRIAACDLIGTWAQKGESHLTRLSPLSSPQDHPDRVKTKQRRCATIPVALWEGRREEGARHIAFLQDEWGT